MKFLSTIKNHWQSEHGDYLIRNTGGTFYIYHGTRYVGAAVSLPEAEIKAKEDDRKVREAYGKA